MAQSCPSPKQFQEKILNSVKTLLALQKTTEISTSAQQSEKYASIIELVLAKFQVDKTVALLHKSASMFASNPSKMGEWINFLQTSFANLLYNGAILLRDTEEQGSLIEFFVGKIRSVKKKMMIQEANMQELTEKYNNESMINAYLVKRLHKADTKTSNMISELDILKHSLRILESDKLESGNKAKSIEQDFESKKTALASEIFALRRKNQSLTTQKKELREAFQDFHNLFISLGF